MLQPNIAESLCGDKAGKEDVAEDEINLVEVPIVPSPCLPVLPRRPPRHA